MNLTYSVEELTKILNAEISGKYNGIISNIKPLSSAGIGDLTFYYDTKYKDLFEKSLSSCIIVKLDTQIAPKENQVFLKVENPYKSFVQLLKIIDNNKHKKKNEIHHTAIIGKNSKISNNVHISANCVIGENCTLANGVKLMPNVVIYDNVIINSNTVINSNVSIYSDSEIGSNCIIHSGAVIGSDGFGYLEDSKTGVYDKIPQLGNVIIEDDVEIGANTTIDRALVGSTIINKGSKIDNLVHIAHNCELGENTGIAAQVGISGSVTSGKNCRFGGQVGIAGHLEITDNVIIYAQSGVSKSIDKSGVYFGSPVKEHLRAFKIEAVQRKLPEIYENIGKLEQKIDEINSKIGD